MDKFIMINLASPSGGGLLERHLDLKVFKDLAFNSKMSVKVSNKEKSLYYNYILVPWKEMVIEDDILKSNITARISSAIEVDESIISSVCAIFQEDFEEIEGEKFSIDILSIIDYKNLNIFYSDGSYKKSTNNASYGVCKLLNEDIEGEKDDLTEKSFAYLKLANVIKDGTNNIGELTGIKTVAENFGNSNYQVIISDSEYSIKVFREWFYNWKGNDFRTYNKKPIANRELIESIWNQIKESKKIVMFKWIKGHNSSVFNDICDKLAKEALSTSI